MCAMYVCQVGVGRGHAGGVRYIYMYPYTDQENALLTTIHIRWFTQSYVCYTITQYVVSLGNGMFQYIT